MLAEMYTKARLCCCRKFLSAATSNSNVGSISLKIPRNLCITIFNQPCVIPKDQLTNLLKFVITDPAQYVLSPLGSIKG